MNEGIELRRKASVFKYFAIIHQNTKPRPATLSVDDVKKKIDQETLWKCQPLHVKVFLNQKCCKELYYCSK